MSNIYLNLNNIYVVTSAFWQSGQGEFSKFIDINLNPHPVSSGIENFQSRVYFISILIRIQDVNRKKITFKQNIISMQYTKQSLKKKLSSKINKSMKGCMLKVFPVTDENNNSASYFITSLASKQHPTSSYTFILSYFFQINYILVCSIMLESDATPLLIKNQVIIKPIKQISIFKQQLKTLFSII